MNNEPEDKKQEDKKTFDIVVNGRKKTVSSKELTFEQVVSLAYDGNPPTGPDILFTVTYKRGEGNKPEGTLEAGGSVKVKDGMIIDVTATNKS
jgi:multiubiquitin